MQAMQARSSLSSSVASSGVASPRSQQVSSAADLTAAVRRTSGERPPPLVGCSIILIGDSIYVFGGRLVPTRTMVSTLYRLDLRTLTWSLLSPSPSSATPPSFSDPSPPSPAEEPQARYFHSACAWGDKLVIFGGEGYEPTSPNGEVPPSPSAGADPSTGPSLRTLDDVCIWDTSEERWILAETKCKEGVERPAPRYAHLGAVTTAMVEEEGGATKEKSVLLIMGGQDLRNTYLHSANVLDLETLTWVHAGSWDRHIGTYRAVCTAPAYTVVPPSTVSSEPARTEKLGLEEGEQLTQLSYSEKPTGQKPEPLLLFSNFNFTAVRRDLDLLASPLSSTPLDPTSLSSSMSGRSLPPGLRFPTGTIIGRHLIVFGTFLSHAINNFSIWALDLGPGGAGGVKERIERGEKLEWQRIDPGRTLARGSWNRAVAWGNTVVVLGDRERDIASDYDHRQTNFTHLAFVDCESFGIYQPPPRSLDSLAQQFGLLTLSQPFLSDFEIVCSDGKRLGCSRKVLLERWSWLAERMEEFKQRASGVQSAQQKREADSFTAASETGDEAKANGDGEDSPKPPADDLRLTSRTLSLPEPSPVVQAFLQYLYTLSLTTPLQLHPPVLAALVVFAKTYSNAELRGACVHALHGVLDREAAAAPLVYEAATVSGATALQIRALRTMLGNSSTRTRASQVPPASQAVDSSSPAVSSAAAPGVSNRFVPPSAVSTFQQQQQCGRPVNTGPVRTAAAEPTSPRPAFERDTPPSPPPSALLPPTPHPNPAPSSPRLPPSPTRRPSLPTAAADRQAQTLKRRSDAVAEPTPDDVPPIPVPSWSPFLPLDLPLHSPPPPRRDRSTSVSSSSQSHQSSEGYFDAVPDLLSDGEESDTATLRTDSLFGSPTQTNVSLATKATSIRSRSSSLGSHRSAKESSGPIAGHWTSSLPTQLEVEEDETVSSSGLTPPLDLPPPSLLSTSASSTSSSSYIAVSPPSDSHSSPRSASSSLSSALHHRPIPRISLPPVFHRKARRESTPGWTAELEQHERKKGAAGAEEHWTPGFFDTMKGAQGSMRNPLSTRKATELTPEMLVSLDVAELASQAGTGVSAPLETLGLPAEDERRFSNPRPAPRPFTADSVGPAVSTISLADSSPSSTPRSSTSSSSTSRRHSFDPTSFRKLYPRPSRGTPAGSTSSLAVPSSSSTPSSSPSPPHSGLASRLRRSGSGKEPSPPAVIVEAPTRAPSPANLPPGGEGAADVLVFDPSSDSTVPLASPPSPALGPLGLPLAPPARPTSPSYGGIGFRRPSLPARLPSPSTNSLVPSVAASVSPTSSISSGNSRQPSSSKLFSALHNPSTSTSSSTSSPPQPPPPQSAPSSPPAVPLVIPKDKPSRLALELSLGRRLLSSAGASENEIRLRARSVGFQVLKKYEEEIKRARKEGREPPAGLGMGLGLSATGALGEYTGGGRLESKFSLD